MPDDFLEQMKKATGFKDPSASATKDSGYVPRVLDDEFAKLGYSPTARLSILGDVGRENSWNPDIIFKGHSDPKNAAYNRGIISWQGDRQKNLTNFLQQKGVYGKHDENELRGMAQFMDHELQSQYPDLHARIKNANKSFDASKALHQYISYSMEPEYNSPDRDYYSANNAKYAKQAQQMGLAQAPAQGMDFDAEMQRLFSGKKTPAQTGPYNPGNAKLPSNVVPFQQPQAQAPVQPVAPAAAPIDPTAAPVAQPQAPVQQPAAPAVRHQRLQRHAPAPQSSAMPAPTEGDVQAYLQYQGLPDTPENRQQFTKELAAAGTGHVETSLDPSQWSINGKSITGGDFDVARPTADGGAVSFPRVAGKPSEDMTGIVGQYQSTPSMSEEDAFRNSLLNVGSRYGITPEGVDGLIQKIKASGKPLFAGGYHPGTPIALDWHDLAQAGVDVHTQQGMEQAQNMQEQPDLRLKPPIYDQAEQNVFNNVNPFSTTTQADVDAERARLGRTELSGDEKQNAASIGDVIKNIFNSPAAGVGFGGQTNAQLAGGAASGLVESLAGRGAEFLAGLYRYSVPGLLDKYGPKSLYTADAINKFANEAKVVGASAKGDGVIYDVGNTLGAAAGDAPRLIGLTVLSGGNPILAFGMDEAVRSAGRDEGALDIASNATHGAIMGGIFHGIGQLGKFAGTAAANKFLTPEVVDALNNPEAEKSFVDTVKQRALTLQARVAYFENPESAGFTPAGTPELENAKKGFADFLARNGMTPEDLASNGTTAMNPLIKAAMRKAALVKILAQRGTSIGLVGATGYASAQINNLNADAKHQQNPWKELALWSIMDAAMGALGKSEDQPWTPEDIAKADGTVIRTPDPENPSGRPKDILLIADPEGKELTATDITGQAPPEVADAAIMPKPEPPMNGGSSSFVPTLTDADVAAATPNAKTNPQVSQPPAQVGSESLLPAEQAGSPSEAQITGTEGATGTPAASAANAPEKPAGESQEPVAPRSPSKPLMPKGLQLEDKKPDRQKQPPKGEPAPAKPEVQVDEAKLAKDVNKAFKAGTYPKAIAALKEMGYPMDNIVRADHNQGYLNDTRKMDPGAHHTLMGFAREAAQGKVRDHKPHPLSELQDKDVTKRFDELNKDLPKGWKYAKVGFTDEGVGLFGPDGKQESFVLGGKPYSDEELLSYAWDRIRGKKNPRFAASKENPEDLKVGDWFHKGEKEYKVDKIENGRVYGSDVKRPERTKDWALDELADESPNDTRDGISARAVIRYNTAYGKLPDYRKDPTLFKPNGDYVGPTEEMVTVEGHPLPFEGIGAYKIAKLPDGKYIVKVEAGMKKRGGKVASILGNLDYRDLHAKSKQFDTRDEAVAAATDVIHKAFVPRNGDENPVERKNTEEAPESKPVDISSPDDIQKGSLPEDVWKMFDKKLFDAAPESARLIPTDSLITHEDFTQDKKFKAGDAHPVIRAFEHMQDTAEGKKGPRAPIHVYDNGDGTYTVLDGNATTDLARRVGWQKVPALVVNHPQSAIAAQNKEVIDLANKVRDEAEKHKDEYWNDVQAAGKEVGGVTPDLMKPFLTKTKESLDKKLALNSEKLPTDLLRSTIVLPQGSVEETQHRAGQVVEAMAKRGYQILDEGNGPAFKNRHDEAPGYKDINLKFVKEGDPVVRELQLIQPEMYAAKEGVRVNTETGEAEKVPDDAYHLTYDQLKDLQDSIKNDLELSKDERRGLLADAAVLTRQMNDAYDRAAAADRASRRNTYAPSLTTDASVSDETGAPVIRSQEEQKSSSESLLAQVRKNALTEPLSSLDRASRFFNVSGESDISNPSLPQESNDESDIPSGIKININLVGKDGLTDAERKAAANKPATPPKPKVDLNALFNTKINKIADEEAAKSKDPFNFDDISLKSVLETPEPEFKAHVYDRVLPRFKQALATLDEADVESTMETFLRKLSEGSSVDTVRQLQPYVVKFFEENVLPQDENGSITKEEAQNVRPDTDNSGTDTIEGSGEQSTAGDGHVTGDMGGGRSGEAEGSGSERPASTSTRPAGSESGPSTGLESGSDESTPADVRDTPNGGDPVARADASNRNFRITNELEFGKSFSPKQRFQTNLAALEILKTLADEKRLATPEEKQALARYVGWGGLSQAFKEEGDWAAQNKRLRDLLTQEEYEAARSSTQNSHYTSQTVVDGIWKALQQFGVKDGNVLEPSMGTGNFFGLRPEGMQLRLTGVELDPLTARIARNLYPQAEIYNRGFQDFYISPESQDVVIGNPPFGDKSLDDPRDRELSKFKIHAYFIAKSINTLRPGGVLGVVVSKGFLDAGDAQASAARKYISDRAELVGAIRLPNTAFKGNANTEVTTDIVFFQKKGGTRDTDIGEGVIEPVDAVEDRGTEWLNQGEVKDAATGEPIAINQYFVNNPHMMLGDMTLAGKMYRAGEPTLEERPGSDLKSDLSDALENLPADIVTDNAAPIVERLSSAESKSMEDYPNMIPYNYGVNDKGELFRLHMDMNGRVTEQPIDAGGKLVERIKAMIGIRDLTTQYLAEQAKEEASDESLEPIRKELNEKYDAFVKKHGYLSQDANKRAFREDPQYPLLQALESKFDKGVSPQVAKKEGIPARNPSAQKSDLLLKRTNYPIKRTTFVDNAIDGLTMSLVNRGGVDLDYISELYDGKTPDDVIQELGDQIFRDPGAEKWVIKDEYLSGDVKTKLEEAEKAAQEDKSLNRNVEALHAVQPKDRGPGEIFLKIGTTWVPFDVYSAFYNHLTEGKLHGAYSDALARFTSIRAEGGNPVLSTSRWGTERARASKILEALMTNKEPVVKDRVWDAAAADYKYVVNQEETAAATGKAEEMRQEFNDWVWKDDERKNRLVKIFNDRLNRIVARHYDGSHYIDPETKQNRIPGLSRVMDLRPHILNGVFRIVQKGKALIDHTVGAGKTPLAITAGMEMRRLGQAKKPTYVVPNHLVDQWAAEFKKFFPGAKVLAASKKDFQKNKRAELFARVATGDWDAVIVAHSSFKFIPVPRDVEMQFMREQIDEIVQAIQEQERAEREDGRRQKSRSIKDLEKFRDKLKDKLKKLASAPKDNLIDFQGMGIDALFVDEAHNYKNLFFTTQKTGVQGLGDAKGSQRAFDMFMKTQMILRRNGDRNAVFLTGTPVSNSLSETFHMQRYLMNDMLKARGLGQFDAWANAFALDVKDYQLNAAGQFIERTRFSKFANLPELRQLWNDITDSVSREDLLRMAEERGEKFPIPKVRTHKVIAERSPEQAAYIGIGKPAVDENGYPVIDTTTGEQRIDYPAGTIIHRLENWKTSLDPKENVLRITTHARQAGLDMRLINADAPDFAGSKINKIVENVARIYHENDHRLGTQLVFLDLATPKTKSNAAPLEQEAAAPVLRTDEEYDDDDSRELIDDTEGLNPEDEYAHKSNFDAYADIRAKLIKAGVPAEQIAYAHDANTDDQKAALFAKVNRGEVRVLIGSSPKMGEGTNVQKKLVALHNGDAPWKPSVLEQRNGRIIRQGNEFYEADKDNFTVDIFNYATDRTYDARMWEVNEQKGTAIDRFRFAPDDVREVEDISPESADAAEMKAAAAGDERIVRAVKLEAEVRKLETQAANHARQQYEMEGRIKAFDAQETPDHARLERFQEASALVEPKSGDAVVRVGDKEWKHNDLAVQTVEGGKGADEKEKERADKARTEFETALSERFKRAKSLSAGGSSLSDSVYLGTYRGFKLLVGNDGYKDMSVILANPTSDRQYVKSTYERLREAETLHISGGGFMRRLDNMVDGFPGDVAMAKNILATNEKNINEAKKLVDKPFVQQQEFDEKRAELQKLRKELRSGGDVRFEANQDNKAVAEFGSDEDGRSIINPERTPKVEFQRTNYKREEDGDPVFLFRVFDDQGHSSLKSGPASALGLDDESADYIKRHESGVLVNKDYDEFDSGLKSVLDKPVQTDTPEFKKWFGDSEVVDKDGNPLVVYHSTENPTFDTFDTRRGDIGSHFGNVKQANDTADRKRGGQWRETRHNNYDNDPTRAAIYPVYLKIENPIRLPDLGNWNVDSVVQSLAADAGLRLNFNVGEAQARLTKEAQLSASLNPHETASRALREELVSAIKAEGFDGIVYANKHEGTVGGFRREPSGDSYIVFDSNQIKSAIGNNGDFDPDNPSILKKLLDPANEQDQATAARMRELANSSLEQVVGEAQQDQSGDRVFLNPAGQELMRRTIEEMKYQAGKLDLNKPEDAEDMFKGQFVPPSMTDSMIRVLRAKAQEAAQKGYGTKFRDAFNKAADALAAANKDREGVILYTFPSAVPEEMFHKADYVGAADKNILNRHSADAKAALDAHPIRQILWEKHFSKFNEYRRLKGATLNAILRAEIPPYLLELSDEQLSSMGITPEQVADYLYTWFKGYADKNGIESLTHFNIEDLHVQTYIEKLKAASGAGENGAVSGKGGEDIRQEGTEPATGPPGDAAGDSGSEVAAEDARRYDPDAAEYFGLRDGQKWASLPATLRRSGIDIDDLAYDVFGDKAAQDDARAMINEHGIEGTIKLLDTVGQLDVHHAMASFMIQRLLLDRAAHLDATDPVEAERLRNFQREVGRKHVLNSIAAGRFTRAASVIPNTTEGIVYSFQGIVADKYKNTGETLSPEHWQKIEAMGRDLEAKDAKLQAAIKEKRRLERQVKRLQEEKEGKRKQRKKSSQANRKQLVARVKEAQQESVDKIRARLRERFGNPAEGVALKSVLASAADSRDENFKKWFRDSKAVDEEGNPLKLYRGVKGEFRDGKSPVPRPRTQGGKNLPKGTIIFTNNPELASNYAGAQKATIENESLNDTGQWWAWPPENADTGNVVPAYLSMQNPLIVDAEGVDWTSVKYGSVAEGNDLLGERAIIHMAHAKGYDGVIFKNLTDTPRRFTAFGHDEYVVFSRSQVKSAIGNNGDFDPSDGSILKSALEPDDDFPIDDFAEVGAMMLTEGIAGDVPYLPEDFKAELMGEYGDAIAPHFEEIYKAAWEKREKWLRDLRKEEAADAIRNKLGEDISDEEVDDILNLRKEAAARRRAIEKIHQLASGGKAIKPGVSDMERIIANIAPNNGVAAIAAVLANDGNANDVRKAFQDLGILDETKRRETLRSADETVKAAKKLRDQERDDVANDLLEAKNELGKIDHIHWQARNDRKAAMRTIADEMRRIKQGEVTYRLSQVADFANIPRTLMASGDLSGWWRQGGVLMFAHPEKMGKAIVNQFKAITDKGYGKVIMDLENMPLFTLFQRAGVDFAMAGKTEATADLKGEEMFRSEQAIEKIPILGKALAEIIVKPSERTYTAFLDTQRATMANVFFQDLLDQGMTFKNNTEEFRKLADFINVATGRGTMPKNQLANVLMNLPLFAPRYTLSRFQLLNMTLNPVAYYNMPPAARKTIAKSAVRFYGTTLAVLGLVSMMGAYLGAKVNWDDDDDDFLKIDIGNTKIDILSGLGPTAKLMIKTVHSAIRAYHSPAYERQYFWDVANAVGRFVRGKLSPIWSGAWDTVEGKDYTGDKAELWGDTWYKPGKTIYSRLIPLTVGDISDAYKLDGLVGAGTAGTAALLGFGVNTYKSPAERPETEAEKLAGKIAAWKFTGEGKEKDARDLKADLVARSRKGEDVTSEIQAGKEKGLLDDYAIRDIKGAKNKSLLIDKAEGLPLEDLYQVMRVATPVEKGELLPLVNKKMKDADVADKLSPSLRSKLEAIGAHVLGDAPMPDDVKSVFKKFDIKTPDVGESMTLTKGGPKTKLGEDAYDAYRKKALTEIYSTVQEAMKDPSFRTYSEAEQQAAIKKIISKVRARQQKVEKAELLGAQ